MSANDVLTIGGVDIHIGETKRIDIPVGRLYTDTEVAIPVYVKRGLKPGSTLFVSAAIHGDELNGIEIISRLIASKKIQNLRGTLIAVPIVNGYGVLNQSRYMPDRRDLNRSFPGSASGSLAGRIAHLFLKEIVAKCDYGIDLHTGAIHRSNLPQLRANLDDTATFEMAKAFGVPVMLNANVRDGSLRASATKLGVPIILYEAGQALRFDELSIMVGLKGIINTLRHLGMLNKTRSKAKQVEPFVAMQSGWIRAKESGFVSHVKELGDFVNKGDVLAEIKSPFGDVISTVVNNREGIIIGKQNIPLVQQGEAVYHVAYFRKPTAVVGNLEIMEEHVTSI
mgnify:CR=1 FL=1